MQSATSTRQSSARPSSRPARRAEDGFDVAIVGAGVVGLAVAAAIVKRGRSVLVLEAESGIARGVTSRNSEIVHAGLYYPKDSLKARFCVEGRERLYAWCVDRSVPHRKVGKLVVATQPDEEPALDDLLARGEANGVEGLTRIDATDVARLEPDVVARSALLSRETGIVDAHAFCLSLQAAAEAEGAVVVLGSAVLSLQSQSFGWRVETCSAAGQLESIDVGVVVNAAGLAADGVAALAGLPIDALGWRQHPCKGDYFKLAPGLPAPARVSLQRLVYPLPQQAGLGIHATLDLAGQIRFGPDVQYVEAPGSAASDTWDFEVDAEKESRFGEAISRYLPKLSGARLVPDYAGIRPKLAAPGEAFRDFVVEEASAHGAPGFIACVGIESPGLTAALAIAEYVAERV